MVSSAAAAAASQQQPHGGKLNDESPYMARVCHVAVGNYELAAPKLEHHRSILMVSCRLFDCHRILSFLNGGC